MGARVVSVLAALRSRARRPLLIAAPWLLACVADPDGDQSGPTGSTGPMPGTSSGGTTLAPPADTSDSGGTDSTTVASSGAPATGSDTMMPPTFDVGTMPDAGRPPVETPPWLLHLALIGGELTLHHVDIETAVPTEICTVIDGATMLPFTDFAYSVTFSRDDRLLFSTGDELWEIELPSCNAVLMGPLGYSGVFGISPDEGDDLFGIDSTLDVLIRIDAQTGQGTEVGPLGNDWFTLGGTWNEVEQQVLGLSGNDDGLYELDQMSGMASLLQTLPLDFFTVGVEFHPLTERIYACTNDSHLYRLENDGSLTDLGDMGFDTCINLGAPWSEGIPLPPPA